MAPTLRADAPRPAWARPAFRAHRNFCAHTVSVACAVSAVLFVILGLGSIVRAQTYTWDPNGTLTDSSGTWTAGAGTWYDGSADTTWTDDGAAAFGWNPGGTASYTVTLGSAVSPTGLIFNNEKYTINLDAGNLYGLTIGASGITDNAAGTTAINAPVTLGTAQTWTIASGSTLAVGGNVSGIPLGALTVAGGGALTLTGNKAYIGGTSINNGGTLNISGGSSNIAIYVGTGGAAATMNVSGATTAVTLDPVGIGQTTAGTLNLFGGTIVERMSSVFVGNSAAGVFNQSGGSVSISMPIYLGYSPGGNGVLNQTGGTSSYGTNNMFIGYGGPGSLTVNGSMALMNIAGNVSVGTETGSGTLTLASGTISQTAGRLYLGYGTTGVFNQTGGLYSFTGSGTFYLGCAGAGTLDLSGGTLIVPAITTNPGGGTFNFNGGMLQAGTNTTSFMAGPAAANVQAGGAIVNTNGYTVTIGQPLLHGTGGGADGGLTVAGSGILTLSGSNTYTGPTIVSSGTLAAGITSVANVSGAFGNNSAVSMINTAGAVLNLNGFNTQIGSLTGGGTAGGNVTLGSATLTVGGDNTSPAAYAGVISGSGVLAKIGNGTLTLSGFNTYTGNTNIYAGTLAVTGALLGGGQVVADSGGTLSLGGLGQVTSSYQTIGNNAAGAVSQSAGINNVTSILYLGYNSGSNGTYNLSGGSLHAGFEIVASRGTGSFTQCGGTNQITGSADYLYIGDGSTSSVSASYSLTAGLLSAPGEMVGAASPGTFTQTGGTNNVGSYTLYIAYSGYPYNNTNVGTYSLGGSGLLSASIESVGWFGSGSLVQTGGTNNANVIDLGVDTGSNGTYNLSQSGQVSASSEVIGYYGGSGTFTQSGGTNSTGSLTLSNTTGSSGTYNLNGGLLTVSSLALGSGTAAAFNLNGGQCILSSLPQNSGPITFRFTGGTLQAGGAFASNVPMTLGTNGGVATIDTAGFAVTLSGPLSGSGSLVKCDSGVLTLSASNSYSNGATITDGTVRVTNSSALGSGPVVLAGGTLSLAAVAQSSIGIHFVGVGGTVVGSAGMAPTLIWNNLAGQSFANSSLYDNNGVNTTASLTASGITSVWASNSSNQLLNGYIAASSSSQLSATISNIPYARYDLYAYIADSSINNGEKVTVNGTTYYFGTTNSASYMQITNTTAGTYPTGNYVVATGLTGSTQTVTAQGSNQQYCSFTGFEIVDTASSSPASPIALANAVTLSADSTIDVTGEASGIITGLVTMGGNRLSLTGGGAGANTAYTLTLGGSGGVGLTGNPTFDVADNGSGVGTLVLGALNDGGTARTITKSDSGVLTLGAAATSMNANDIVNVTGGTLNSNNTSALGTRTTVNLASGATFSLGAGQTLAALGDAGTIILNAANVQLNGDVLTIGSGVNPSSTFSGVIADGTGGAGILVKAGTGILTLAGANTYSGGTTILGGELSISNSANLGGGNVTIGAGALQTTGAVVLDAARTITLADAASAIDTPQFSDTTTLNGPVIGTGSLNKEGAGILTLAAPSGDSYAGDTNVLAGILDVAADNALSPTSNLVIGDGASVILDFGGGAGSEALPDFLSATPSLAAPSLATPAASPAGLSTVPEPGTLVLLLVGSLAGLIVWQRRLG